MSDGLCFQPVSDRLQLEVKNTLLSIYSTMIQVNNRLQLEVKNTEIDFDNG